MKYRVLLAIVLMLAGCTSAPGSGGPKTSAATTSESPTSVTTSTDRTTSPTATTAETQSQTPTPKGSVRAQVVENPPENATVVSFDNETLQKEKYRVVRSVVTDAVQDESGFAQQYVYGDAVEDTVGVMSAFPYYESGGQAGIYVEKNGTVVEVLAYREDG